MVLKKCCYCGQLILTEEDWSFWEDCDSEDKHYGKPIHKDCAREWRIEIKIEANPNAADIGAYLPTKKDIYDS
jgi:hypothetical protein